MVRRSLREKWQPNNLKDYKVKLNHYNVTSYFFTGAFDEEPTCYEEAKGCQKWEIEMQEEIYVLRKRMIHESYYQSQKATNQSFVSGSID